MTPSEFLAYLEGFIVAHPQPPNAAEWRAICTKLNSVFTKVTPDRHKVPTYCNGPDQRVCSTINEVRQTVAGVPLPLRDTTGSNPGLIIHTITC